MSTNFISLFFSLCAIYKCLSTNITVLPSPLSPFVNQQRRASSYPGAGSQVLPELLHVESGDTLPDSIDSNSADPLMLSRRLTNETSISGRLSPYRLPCLRQGTPKSSPDLRRTPVRFEDEITAKLLPNRIGTRRKNVQHHSQLNLTQSKESQTSGDLGDAWDSISIQLVFIALALCGLFCSSTIILLIVIICRRHSDKMFMKHTQRLHSIHEESMTNNVKRNQGEPMSPQDLYQQFETLQTIISNMITRNTSIQHSTDSLQHFQGIQHVNEYEINANNQPRPSNVSINPIRSPYNTNIPHQLHAFQNSNNSNYSNSSNHNTDIVSIPIDNNLLAEFLEFKRQSSQQNYV